MNLQQQQTQFANMLAGNKLDTRLFTGEPTKVKQRLAIYQDSIQGNRVNALTTLFKACKAMLGDEYWLHLVDDFIVKTAFYQLDSHACGAQFSEFLTQHDVINHVPYIADLAKLEWAWHQCFHQATPVHTSMSLTEAIKQYGDALLLRLSNGLQLLMSQYPLYDLWQLAQHSSDNVIELDNSSTEYYFILYREHDSITIKQVEQSAWRICQCLEYEAQTLIKLCEMYLCEHQQPIDTHVLTQLVEQHIIIWSA